jgi:hypothetical protein
MSPVISHAGPGGQGLQRGAQGKFATVGAYHQATEIDGYRDVDSGRDDRDLGCTDLPPENVDTIGRDDHRAYIDTEGNDQGIIDDLQFVDHYSAGGSEIYNITGDQLETNKQVQRKGAKASVKMEGGYVRERIGSSVDEFIEGAFVDCNLCM